MVVRIAEKARHKPPLLKPPSRDARVKIRWTDEFIARLSSRRPRFGTTSNWRRGWVCRRAAAARYGRRGRGMGSYAEVHKQEFRSRPRTKPRPSRSRPRVAGRSQGKACAARGGSKRGFRGAALAGATPVGHRPGRPKGAPAGVTRATANQLCVRLVAAPRMQCSTQRRGSVRRLGLKLRGPPSFPTIEPA
jgi:hypothetical protein